MQHLSKTSVTYSAIGAVAAWLAVVLQLYLIILNRETTVTDTLIKFFSFFTILTNIMVATAFTVLWLRPNTKWGDFFSQTKVLTAITVYIVVVGITYNAILRVLWQPQGMQRVVDESLHLIIPLYFLIFWLVFVPKKGLAWKDMFPWLIYPLVYLVYILIRGAFSDQYPYPFMEVNTLGYHQVLINSAMLVIGFIVLSLLFIGVAKMISNRDKTD